jgi:ribosome recycling factor
MKLNTKDFEERMGKAIYAYEQNIGSVRAGQASTAVLSKINFEYWGAPTSLMSMADVRVADSKTVTITPYDATTLKAMEKAILASDLGITPTNDGKIIRIVFPQPTEERRKELVKQVQKMAEDGKVAIRNIRRDALDQYKKLKKDSVITEDDEKRAGDAMQKMTDKFINTIDSISADMEKELLSI